MQTDDALMQRVREGDEDAFAQIVDRYKNSLTNYLTHLVRSRERAEEVAQDAFVRLYRNAAKYRQDEKLGPYLFRIATNLVVSEMRRAKRWTLLLPRLHASTAQHAPAPDAALLSDEIQRHVSQALETLPIKYRAPLVLFELEEWPYDAIAAALGLPLGTVKSRISRARELLRGKLAPYWTRAMWTGGTNDERHSTRRIASGVATHERVADLHL
ncbi:MAG TPA: sigma-70 family RNA polymerase sigma factor [Thermoanaerobaculia bacterium]|jgi:RNA polymerase sigma-70 factor (ECF subfamily)